MHEVRLETDGAVTILLVSRGMGHFISTTAWLAVGFFLTTSPLSAKTFTVNNAGDEVGIAVGNGVCETAPGNGVCTLRRALAETRELIYRGVDPTVTIYLRVPGGVLTLPPGSGSLNVGYEGSGDVTIVGAGADDTIIDAAGATGFELYVRQARISGLTIRNARFGIIGARIALEHIRVTDSEIGALIVGGYGATVVGSEFLRNRGSADYPDFAGGIDVSGSNVDGGSTSIGTTLISGNRGQQGGGLRVHQATVYLDGVTLSDNTADDSGGGIFVSDLARIRAVNVTVSGNRAARYGGGIFNDGGEVVLTHATVANNEVYAILSGAETGGGIATRPGQQYPDELVRLDHAVLADNRQRTGGPAPVASDCAGALVASGPTLISAPGCTVSGTAPIVGSAGLGPLQDNGGHTPTHALLAGSAAIDAGRAGTCLATSGAPLDADQRGYKRAAGLACDLGSVEFASDARPRALRRDLNGDRQPDLIWRHWPTGANAAWFMQDRTVVGAPYLKQVADLQWDILASDDFDGDGYADLLWKRDTGQLAVWLMRGGEVRAAGYLPALDSTAWQLAGTGDFDGDDRIDILWQQAGGRTMLWLLDGVALKAALPLRSADWGWAVVGVADANGDGKVDVLWRHQPTGTNVLWLMDGRHILTDRQLPTVPGSSWTVATLADLDGDGYADILWRTTNTRAPVGVYAWYLSGTGIRYGRSLPTVDTGWHFLWPVPRVDGGADLLWRRASDGQLAYWSDRPGQTPASNLPSAHPSWTPR